MAMWRFGYAFVGACRVWALQVQRFRAALRQVWPKPSSLFMYGRWQMQTAVESEHCILATLELMILDVIPLCWTAGPAVSITPLSAGPAVAATLTLPTPVAFFPLAGNAPLSSPVAPDLLQTVLSACGGFVHHCLDLPQAHTHGRD